MSPFLFSCQFMLANLLIYSNQYFSLTDDLEKKKMALEVLQEGMEKLADERGWDKQVFREIYNKIKELNYKNTFIYKKKSSPNRRYICSHEC
ncbi:hypothetical protein [Geobacillus sp. YF-1]|uniref:hypothetical protein n=1 Tax=Geobacillus sp. YF-1 TaxID=3457480 RepID=UPI004045DFF5